MDKLREVFQRFAGSVPQLAQKMAASGGGGGGGPVIGTGMMTAALGTAGVGLAAYGGSSCLFNVEGGHRAVMFHRFGGVQKGVRAEGTGKLSRAVNRRKEKDVIRVLKKLV